MPIIEHPDVRRMLLSSKGYVEAMRAILYQTSYYLDMSHLTEGEESERYNSYVEMLTPICKAWCSEWGLQVTHTCLQVHGGYGYTSDYPAEQFMRDVEIACIYEGTNGIQALDFVARKLPMNNGQTIRELLGMAESTFKKLKSDPEMMEPAWMLAAALKQIETISKELTKRPDAIQLILLNAPPLLDMVGTVNRGPLPDGPGYPRQDKARRHPRREQGVGTDDKKAYKEFLKGNDEAAFYHNKIQTAIHFAYRALPTVAAKGAAIRSGEKRPRFTRSCESRSFPSLSSCPRHSAGAFSCWLEA